MLFAPHQEEVGNLAPYLAPGPSSAWQTPHNRLEPLGILPPPTGGCVSHLILAMLSLELLGLLTPNLAQSCMTPLSETR